MVSELTKHRVRWGVLLSALYAYFFINDGGFVFKEAILDFGLYVEYKGIKAALPISVSCRKNIGIGTPGIWPITTQNSFLVNGEVWILTFSPCGAVDWKGYFPGYNPQKLSPLLIVLSRDLNAGEIVGEGVPSYSFKVVDHRPSQQQANMYAVKNREHATAVFVAEKEPAPSFSRDEVLFGYKYTWSKRLSGGAIKLIRDDNTKAYSNAVFVGPTNPRHR